MERTMSVEEKIRRAEEIYARRNNCNYANTARVRVNGKEKKDIKVFKKLIIQIMICLFIYGVFYLVKNSNYIFSEDFVNKAKEVLSYDTNFGELYNNAKNAIIGFFNKEEQADNTQVNNSEQGNEQENKNPAESETKTENQETENTNTSQDGIGGTAETQEPAPVLSEEEQRIQTIKNTTSFIKPVEGPISSKFGLRNPTTKTVPKNHTGTDIKANTGTKIKSATDGEVVLASSEGDYGNHLKIQIGEVSVIYAHCNKLYVKQGDKVTQGQEIAEVGSTGNSTGPHLHFEIRLNETAIDPEKILQL
ncbi:MAG: M23 family metallopeptidase [Clostridia bacterium]|nr:M23 family metallopeptidase [Clostridia bacterium]